MDFDWETQDIPHFGEAMPASAAVVLGTAIQYFFAKKNQFAIL